MIVIAEDVKWDRTAILKIENDKVIFDTSDGEYGPCEISLSLLKEKIEEYESNKERKGSS